jgi:integrase
MEFTESYIRQLKPAAQRYSEWCSANDPRGLGIRVTPTGVKSYVLQTLDRPGGKQVLVTLGHAGTLRLPAARKAAWAALERVQAGQNPNQEKRQASSSTFGALVETYIEDELASKRQGRTVETYLRRDWLGELPYRARVTQGGKTEWVTEWKPGRDRLFSDRLAAAITREDILDRLNVIRSERGKYAARHALAAIRQCLNFAAEHHRAGVRLSPAAGLRDKTVGLTGATLMRQRILTEDEMRAIWAACPSVGIFGVLVRVLLLTAQRRDDWASASWKEITGLQGAEPMLTVPSARYKTGAVHEVPLTPMVVRLLGELPRVQGCSWIFTNDGQRPSQSFTLPKRRLDKESGVTGWTLHDLRRTGRTLMANLEVDDATAERVLGHAFGGSLMATYNVAKHRKPKRAALMALEQEILRIVEQPTEAGNNVVAISTALHPSVA